MMLSGLKKYLHRVSNVQCVLATVGKSVPDLDSIFGQLNFNIETWSIMVKMCKIIPGTRWRLKFWATSRRFPRRWKKPRKNWQKWCVPSGVHNFNCNFRILNFEIESWSVKVKRRKLSKEFDGIGIF